MNPTEIEKIQQLVYEYHRLWIDKYGQKRTLPTYFLDAIDVLEKRYGLLFNVDTWQWEKIR